MKLLIVKIRKRKVVITRVGSRVVEAFNAPLTACKASSLGIFV